MSRALAVGIAIALGCAQAQAGEVNHQGCLEDLPYSINVIAFVQTELKRAGYFTGKVDGKLGPATSTAIERFRSAKNLPGSGRIDPRLLATLMSEQQYASVMKELPLDRCEGLDDVIGRRRALGPDGRLVAPDAVDPVPPVRLEMPSTLKK